jgi:hypothetical protein
VSIAAWKHHNNCLSPTNQPASKKDSLPISIPQFYPTHALSVLISHKLLHISKIIQHALHTTESALQTNNYRRYVGCLPIHSNDPSSLDFPALLSAGSASFAQPLNSLHMLPPLFFQHLPFKTRLIYQPGQVCLFLT